MWKLSGRRGLWEPHHARYRSQYGGTGGKQQQQKKHSTKVLILNFVPLYAGTGLVLLFLNPKHIKLIIENGVH